MSNFPFNLGDRVEVKRELLHETGFITFINSQYFTLCVKQWEETDGFPSFLFDWGSEDIVFEERIKRKFGKLPSSWGHTRKDAQAAGLLRRLPPAPEGDLPRKGLGERRRAGYLFYVRLGLGEALGEQQRRLHRDAVIAVAAQA